MKVCPICGSKFDGEVVFCPHDGTRLEEMTKPGSLTGKTLNDGQLKLSSLMFGDDVAERYTSRIGDVSLRVLVLNQRLRPAAARFESLGATKALLGEPMPESLTTLHHWDAQSSPAYVVESGVRGPTLRQLLAERGPLDVETAIRLTCSIARALGWLFDHGVIHRALSSTSVHVVDIQKGTIQLAEWSVGLLGYHQNPQQALADGKFVITPEYSAPELIENAEQAGEKSSIYSLGLLLYEMLTTKVYFEAPTAQEVINLQLGDDRPSLSSAYEGRDLPEDLDELFSLLVNKSLDQRFQSLHAVVNALCSQVEGLSPDLFPKIERADSPRPNPLAGASKAKPAKVQEPEKASPAKPEDSTSEEVEDASRKTQLFIQKEDEEKLKEDVSASEPSPESSDSSKEESDYAGGRTLKMSAVPAAEIARTKKRRKKKKKSAPQVKVDDDRSNQVGVNDPEDSSVTEDSSASSSIVIDPALLDDEESKKEEDTESSSKKKPTTKGISGASATLDSASPEEEPKQDKDLEDTSDRTGKLPEVEKQLRALEEQKSKEKAKEKKKPIKASSQKPAPAPADAVEDEDVWFNSSSENTWDQEVLREHAARTDQKVRTTLITILVILAIVIAGFMIYILFVRPEDKPDEEASYQPHIERHLDLPTKLG